MMASGSFAVVPVHDASRTATGRVHHALESNGPTNQDLPPEFPGNNTGAVDDLDEY